MVGQVVVDPAGCDGPRSGEGERRERVWVIERGDLGDHPADADASQVRRPVVKFAGEHGGVGCEITQRVRRRLGIDAGRRAAVLCWSVSSERAIARKTDGMRGG